MPYRFSLLMIVYELLGRSLEGATCKIVLVPFVSRFKMPSMAPRQRNSMAATVAVLLLASSPMRSQSGSGTKQLAGTQSIGDVMESADHTGATPVKPETIRAEAMAFRSAQPIHILYMHGINQVGAGDSLFLRQGICKYLGECTVTNLGRVYAENGPFALNHAPPALAYMQAPIWKTIEDWNASAPFIDRYKIAGNGHAPIMLDELNWWPIAYPLKCQWLIPSDAGLTGPSRQQMDICAAVSQPDQDHPGRYLAYRWIQPPEAAELNGISRHATFANRSLKNGLMDWGFGDAVMALGPVQEILTAGIRQLLMKSLEAAGVNLQTSSQEDAGPDFFFITHSLGSYLSLAALDSEWLGPETPELSEFLISPEEKAAADYFAAHTAGFYFLANQVELLELARVSAPNQPDTNPSSSVPAKTRKPRSITHWRSMRQSFLEHRSSLSPGPQIIAWSDPNDLLSWDVPHIDGVNVVNIHVRNSGFKIPPFVVWPTGAHDNYAKNSKVLRVIFKPTRKR